MRHLPSGLLHSAAGVVCDTAAITGTPLENKSLEDVILVAKTTNNAALFNNSAQLWNHSFYWDCMAPTDQVGQISPELEKLIKESFGSVADFKKKVRGTCLLLAWGTFVR